MITDQQTDRSRQTLHKLLGGIADPGFKETVKSTNFDTNSLANADSTSFADPGKRMFPVNTPENAILSKVYFDGQKTAMQGTHAETIHKNLSKHLALHNIPESQFAYKTAEDTSPQEPEGLEEPVYLLPEHQFCKVATERDLAVAEKVFERGVDRLQLADRVTFARNFVKVSEDLERPINSEEIMKYASMLDFDAVHTQCALEMRTGLARRRGIQEEGFRKLAQTLEKFSGEPSREELQKLAEVITDLDKQAGFTEKDYKVFIESPYGAVFARAREELSKIAEDTQDSIKTMTKSDIVGKYGADVLEMVETEDGQIDYDALKSVVQLEKGFNQK